MACCCWGGCATWRCTWHWLRLRSILHPSGCAAFLPVWHCWPSPCSWRAAFRRTRRAGYLFCLLRSALTLRTRPVRWPETVAAVVLAALIGPAKAIYLPAVLLIFMIPDANLALPGKRWPVGPIAKFWRWCWPLSAGCRSIWALLCMQPRCGYRGHPARRWCRRGRCRFAGAAVLEDSPRPQKEENLLGAIAAVVVLAIPVGCIS